jgi:hypothetical protein
VKFGYINFGGYDATRLLALEVHAEGPLDLPGSVPLSVATYQIGGPRSSYGANSYVFWGTSCNPPQGCDARWQAQPEMGTGTVTITTLTDTSVTGTFSVGLLPEANSAARGSVAMNGRFRVTF